MAATISDSTGHMNDTGAPSGHCSVMVEPAKSLQSTIGPMARINKLKSMPMMAEDKLFSDILFQIGAYKK
jgi:hypothetical protein